MSAGLAWNENLPWDDPANNERRMDDAADPYRYALEQPIATQPGQFYNYCGAAPTLLQGVVQRASGKALDVLAREALLEPLGITDVEATRFPNGDVRGYGGLRLRARDLAKIGQPSIAALGGRRVRSLEWTGLRFGRSTGKASSSTATYGGLGAFSSSAGKSVGSPGSVMGASGSISCPT